MIPLGLLLGGTSLKTIICSAVKGGVGKTKVTAGLGKALTRRGNTVAYLDLDYFAPNLNVELEVTDPLDGDGDGHIIPSRTKDGSQFVSFGQEYLADQAVTVAEDSAVYDITEVLREGSILWDSPDYLVVDTAPTSSVVIQQCLAAPGLLGTVLITQPSRVSRADLLRSLSLMKDKQVPVLGLVINQAYCICPQCGHEYSAFDLTPADMAAVAREWGVPVVGELPFAANLDPFFDQLAANVCLTAPVLIPLDKKPSKLSRRLLTWASKMLSATTTKK